MTAPANDEFINAILLFCNDDGDSDGPYSINDATVDGGEPDPDGFTAHQTVWYMWDSEVDGSVFFGTYGSEAGDSTSGDGDGGVGAFGNLKTVIAAYYGGPDFAGLVPIDATDTGSLVFDAVDGLRYYIQIGTQAAGYTGDLLASFFIPCGTEDSGGGSTTQYGWGILAQLQ